MVPYIPVRRNVALTKKQYMAWTEAIHGLDSSPYFDLHFIVSNFGVLQRLGSALGDRPTKRHRCTGIVYANEEEEEGALLSFSLFRLNFLVLYEL